MSEPYIESDLWIDRPDSEEALATKTASNPVKDAIRSLIRDGITVIRGAHAPELCCAVVDDYERYVETNRDCVMKNLDALDREKRLVNFHLWSSSAAKIGTNPKVMG